MTRSDPLSHWEGEPVRVWESLWGIPELKVFSSIDSTNLELRRRRPLPADFAVVIAEEQTAGRGRGGSGWSSRPGGLFMSWTFTPRTAAAAPLVPLRTGIAVARAIEGLCGTSVGIKWPNDIWADDRKLAGILCEGGPAGVVVGVGINVRSVPRDPDLRRPAVSLEALVGEPVSRARLAGAILNGAQELLGRGGSVLRSDEMAELDARDVLAGRSIKVVPGPEGMASGVDEHGRLRVRQGSVVTRVTSGSIELLDG